MERLVQWTKRREEIVFTKKKEEKENEVNFYVPAVLSMDEIKY